MSGLIRVHLTLSTLMNSSRLYAIKCDELRSAVRYEKIYTVMQNDQ